MAVVRPPFLLASLALVAVTGCPEPAAPAAAPAAAEAEAKVEAPEAEAKDPRIPTLTQEDLDLLAKDPKDLTPEMRVKRAHARRRQIMQNPDSPAARVLQDLAEAHQAGELELEKGRDGVWLHTPGSKPASGRPPAGWREGDVNPNAAPPEGTEPPAGQ